MFLWFFAIFKMKNKTKDSWKKKSKVVVEIYFVSAFIFFQNWRIKKMTSASKTVVSAPLSVVPDGGWGWVIVFASFMIHFIMDGFVTSFVLDWKLNLIMIRITYSMGDVFLRPMMNHLNKSRGPVSTIFGILPAITLGIGKRNSI